MSYAATNQLTGKLCGLPTQAPNPFAGLFEHEFTTSSGLVLRCYLEYAEAEDGGNDHPSEPEDLTLQYAFVGVIDISEVLSEDWVMTIEEEAFQAMKQQAADSRLDAYLARSEA